MSYKIDTKLSWEQTVAQLRNEFSLWGIAWEDWDVTRPPKGGTEVTVTYKKNGRDVKMTYDKQNSSKNNLRAIYLTIHDLRMIDVREVGNLAAAHYKQIAAPEGEINIDPYEVLGVRKGMGIDVYKAVYRTMASKYHPDSKPSGDPAMMAKLNKAIKLIEDELK